MRSPYHSRASRDYNSHSKSRNNRSASPSPPRPTQKNLKSIRITIANVPGKPLSGSQVSSNLDSTAIHILREINFGYFKAPKNCHVDHFNSSEF